MKDNPQPNGHPTDSTHRGGGAAPTPPCLPPFPRPLHAGVERDGPPSHPSRHRPAHHYLMPTPEPCKAHAVGAPPPHPPQSPPPDSGPAPQARPTFAAAPPSAQQPPSPFLTMPPTPCLTPARTPPPSVPSPDQTLPEAVLRPPKTGLPHPLQQTAWLRSFTCSQPLATPNGHQTPVYLFTRPPEPKRTSVSWAVTRATLPPAPQP